MTDEGKRTPRMEQFVSAGFFIPLLVGALLGALFGFWANIWYIRLVFLAGVGAVVAASVAAVLVQQHPLFFFRVPNRELTLALFSGGIAALLIAMAYLILFTPQPNLQITSVQFQFVPNSVMEDGKLVEKFLIFGTASYFNSGQTSADNVKAASYVYRRPEPCALRPLSGNEIQALEDQVHENFISRLPENTPSPAEVIPMIPVRDIVPVNTPFSGPPNTGENLTAEQVQEFYDGKCIIFLASRIRYGEVRYVDYLRYAYKDPRQIVPVKRYEARF